MKGMRLCWRWIAQSAAVMLDLPQVVDSSTTPTAQEYCPRCGVSTPRAAVTLRGCPHCVGIRIAWDQVWRLGAYEPPLSTRILQAKFHGREAWIGAWAEEMAAMLPRQDRAVVTAVPMHWLRRVHRGGSLPEAIARRVAKRLDIPVARLLRRVRHTPPQSRLHDPRARRANVRRAFAALPINLAGWTVWLIDDVKTSGATAGRCARLLKRMGAERVNLAVVAVGEGKSGRLSR
jgi:predicted amidophosphoribosyltransferase